MADPSIAQIVVRLDPEISARIEKVRAELMADAGKEIERLRAELQSIVTAYHMGAQERELMEIAERALAGSSNPIAKEEPQNTAAQTKRYVPYYCPCPSCTDKRTRARNG